jgi:hypothetical protein
VNKIIYLKHERINPLFHFCQFDTKLDFIMSIKYIMPAKYSNLNEKNCSFKFKCFLIYTVLYHLIVVYTL